MTWQTELLEEDDWHRLQDIRLHALQQDPSSFLSTFKKEEAYKEDKWRDEYSRGDWTILVEEGKTIGLLGVTREPDTTPGVCYLEYMWVDPSYRKQGRGSGLVNAVLRRLKSAGTDTVLLWVLDGNSEAEGLYRGIGFDFTGERQQLPGDPGRYENLMRLSLSSEDQAESADTQ